ncbi:MAG: DUF502 domain-containing protein [Planctomycetota bacterium]
MPDSPNEFDAAAPADASADDEAGGRKQKRGRFTEPVDFGSDFRRFFLRGLGTLLPTVITIGLIWWLIDFLWNSIGFYVVQAIKGLWLFGVRQGFFEETNRQYIDWFWQDNKWWTKPVGVLAALILIYIVGLLVGNVLGRAFYRLAERLVMRIPVVRALYPPVKQVTDFLLADKEGQYAGSSVVAVKPHAGDIWSIALVTGQGLPALTEATEQEMVTVFVPSSPTAFSGYVMVAPRKDVVELPMKVEQAMRLLVSGGVLMPDQVRNSVGTADSDVQTKPKTPAPAIATRAAAVHSPQITGEQS